MVYFICHMMLRRANEAERQLIEIARLPKVPEYGVPRKPVVPCKPVGAAGRRCCVPPPYVAAKASHFKPRGILICETVRVRKGADFGP